MKRILVVEDEWKMRKLIKDFLVKDGYHVEESGDGSEALKMWGEGEYDLVILDVMLPGVDGWSICKKIRKESNVPVIMLTARGEEDDELFGFEIGADEYITKPFSPKLLTARVASIFRRVGKPDKMVEGGLRVLESERRVFIDDKEIDLTNKMFDLLVYLVQNKGISLSREKILSGVWGWDFYGDFRTVDTQIKRLRQKIGSDYIVTVRGHGYRFDGDSR